MEPKKEITAAASPRRVILESPFAGDEAVNRSYLKACLRDSLSRGEAPLASHALYPGALDDSVPAEREAGMAAGRAWYGFGRAVVVYTDLGISPGMAAGIEHAQDLGKRLEFRSLPAWAEYQAQARLRGIRDGYAEAGSKVRRLQADHGEQQNWELPKHRLAESLAEYPGKA